MRTWWQEKSRAYMVESHGRLLLLICHHNEALCLSRLSSSFRFEDLLNNKKHSKKKLNKTFMQFFISKLLKIALHRAAEKVASLEMLSENTTKSPRNF